MKTFVLTVSRYFPKTHKRAGEPTCFLEKILSEFIVCGLICKNEVEKYKPFSMFVFNTDLILYRIGNPLMIVLIFTMTLMGAFAFTSFVQGWFMTRNRWYDGMFLLGAALILFNPSIIAFLIPVNIRGPHWMYVFGMMLLSGVFFMQKLREKYRGDPGYKRDE